MGFLAFIRFLLSLIVSFFFLSSATIALGSGLTFDDIEIHEVALEKEAFDTLDDYPQPNPNRRCELIVVIINLQDNYRQQRFSFWGEGKNWRSARNGAFSNYQGRIESGNFYRGRYNHSFRFNNCQ